MSRSVHVTLAQLNLIVGDIAGNTERIVQAAQTAFTNHNADLVVFPEMALTGYPPEDLLLRPSLHNRCRQALQRIIAEMPDTTIILGMPWQDQEQQCLYNSAVVLQNNAVTCVYHKQHLPNYTVFDERRHFTAGSSAAVFTLKGIQFGLLICEDLWHPQPAEQAAASGAQCLIAINASPFDYQKNTQRQSLIQQRTQQTHCPLIYMNLVGGQDELVFDGGSMLFNAEGTCIQQANFFKEELIELSLPIDNNTLVLPNVDASYTPNTLELIYNALVLGVHDYINKNNFPTAIIGLSGGIDSALTLAIACDALGSDRVSTIMMPSQFTSEMSLVDAEEIATNFQVKHQTIPIEKIKQTVMTELDPLLKQRSEDTTDENVQARIRGLLLMGLSNKYGAIVLTTGNKSEMAIGYATLYGDMAGGFCVLKDIPKTLVYQLANYRNQQSNRIPQRIIDRPPSAELAANQKDQDSLPPYETLDAILYQYIDCERTEDEICQAGHDSATVKKTTKLVRRNEYKRRQAPIGIRISEHAFGRDRRYPITSGF